MNPQYFFENETLTLDQIIIYNYKSNYKYTCCVQTLVVILYVLMLHQFCKILKNMKIIINKRVWSGWGDLSFLCFLIFCIIFLYQILNCYGHFYLFFIYQYSAHHCPFFFLSKHPIILYFHLFCTIFLCSLLFGTIFLLILFIILISVNPNQYLIKES